MNIRDRIVKVEWVPNADAPDYVVLPNRIIVLSPDKITQYLTDTYGFKVIEWETI